MRNFSRHAPILSAQLFEELIKIGDRVLYFSGYHKNERGELSPMGCTVCNIYEALVIREKQDGQFEIGAFSLESSSFQSLSWFEHLLTCSFLLVDRSRIIKQKEQPSLEEMLTSSNHKEREAALAVIKERERNKCLS